MPLSNPERQALYRQRLKERAAQVDPLSAALVEIILNSRRNIRSWKRVRTLYTSGMSRFYTNNVDDTLGQIQSLDGLIRQSEEFIARFDSSGLISDGQIEIGEVCGDIVVSLWAGRAVSYVLDSDGRAIDLRIFESEISAQADARNARRLSGLIGNEHWSVMPVISADHCGA